MANLGADSAMYDFNEPGDFGSGQELVLAAQSTEQRFILEGSVDQVSQELCSSYGLPGPFSSSYNSYPGNQFNAFDFDSDLQMQALPNQNTSFIGPQLGDAILYMEPDRQYPTTALDPKLTGYEAPSQIQGFNPLDTNQYGWTTTMQNETSGYQATSQSQGSNAGAYGWPDLAQDGSSGCQATSQSQGSNAGAYGWPDLAQDGSSGCQATSQSQGFILDPYGWPSTMQNKASSYQPDSQFHESNHWEMNHNMNYQMPAVSLPTSLVPTSMPLSPNTINDEHQTRISDPPKAPETIYEHVEFYHDTTIAFYQKAIYGNGDLPVEEYERTCYSAADNLVRIENLNMARCKPPPGATRSIAMMLDTVLKAYHMEQEEMAPGAEIPPLRTLEGYADKAVTHRKCAGLLLKWVKRERQIRVQKGTSASLRGAQGQSLPARPIPSNSDQALQPISQDSMDTSGTQQQLSYNQSADGDSAVEQIPRLVDPLAPRGGQSVAMSQARMKAMISQEKHLRGKRTNLDERCANIYHAHERRREDMKHLLEQPSRGLNLDPTIACSQVDDHTSMDTNSKFSNKNHPRGQNKRHRSPSGSSAVKRRQTSVISLTGE